MGNKPGDGDSRSGGGGGGGGGAGGDALPVCPAYHPFPFERVKIGDWGRKHVTSLLDACGFGEISQQFLSAAHTGAQVLQLGAAVVELEDGLSDEDKQLLFHVVMHHIVTLATPPDPSSIDPYNPYFYFKYYVVAEKLLRNLDEEDVEEIGMDDICYNIEVLSDEDKLADRYLTFQAKRGASTKLPVKIIVTESFFQPRQLLTRKIVSPVVNIFPHLRPDFGFFHTAVIIQTVYIHWTDAELIVPKALASSVAFLAFDVKQDKEDWTPEESSDLTLLDGHRDAIVGQQVETVRSNLARLIVRWNTRYSYKSVPDRNKLEGNCQSFIQDCAQTLGIRASPPEGPLKDYLDRIRRTGKSKMKFSPSRALKERFGLNLKSYTFRTHQELDVFYSGLLAQDSQDPDDDDAQEPVLELNHRDEVMLLKAFDRAFWLRFFKDPENETFRPLEAGCPFDDPRRTESMVVF